MMRRGTLLIVVLTAALSVACDHYRAFYIRNGTGQTHYVRVDSDGYIYVHRIGPRESGYAVRHFVAGWAEEDDALTVELLDAACRPIDEWRMPSGGGYLEIRTDEAEFTPGAYFEGLPTSGASNDATQSVGPAGSELETVMECGATDVL